MADDWYVFRVPGLVSLVGSAVRTVWKTDGPHSGPYERRLGTRETRTMAATKTSSGLTMRRLLAPGLDLACVLSLVLVCFGAVLFHDRQFSFRDVAHFYYPLYQRVQQEWEAGRLPLWEPEENAGMPLLGNPTAAVLYPGKLVYAILPYPLAAKLYIVLHVVLAAGAMFALARHWEVSRTGATLAALSYAFGVPVLFQYCNVVFLVGAAWLPLGLRACDRWLRLGRRWGLIELALVLALQTLGGDPETAYLLGVCAGGYALMVRVRRDPSARWPVWPWIVVGLVWIVGTCLLAAVLVPGPKPLHGLSSANKTAPWLVLSRYLRWPVLAGWGCVALGLGLRWKKDRGASLVPGLVGLGGAAVLAGTLIGVQLLPTLEFTSRTIRAAADGGHEVFAFGLEPQRLPELLWPGIYGAVRSQNGLWLKRVLPDGTYKMWVPSLYVGALTVVLAAGAWGLRHGRPGRDWLAAIALVSLLGACGPFASPIWVARSLPAGAAVLGPHDPILEGEARRDQFVPDGFGSPYWLMVELLPGFGSFRYPAKLFTFTSLALSGLAGMGWDRVAAGQRRRVVVLAVGGALLGVGLLLGTIVFRDALLAFWQADPNQSHNSSFGPFLPLMALAETRWALVQGSLVLLLGALLGLFAGPAGRDGRAGGRADDGRSRCGQCRIHF